MLPNATTQVANRMYSASSVCAQGVVNASNGFQLENTTTNHGLMQIDNDNDVSLSLFSTNNIDFNILRVNK